MIKKVIRKLFGEKEEQKPSSVSERKSSTNSVYADTLGIKPLDRKISPKQILQDVFPGVQWNISGGWGYSQDEATVIHCLTHTTSFLLILCFHISIIYFFTILLFY